MKEFEPSQDFVARVMDAVRQCEVSRRAEGGALYSRLVGSRLFRCAMSACGAFFGIFFSPVVCG